MLIYALAPTPHFNVHSTCGALVLSLIFPCTLAVAFKILLSSFLSAYITVNYSWLAGLALYMCVSTVSVNPLRYNRSMVSGFYSIKCIRLIIIIRDGRFFRGAVLVYIYTVREEQHGSNNAPDGLIHL